MGIGKNVEGVGRGSLLGQGVQPVNEHQPPGGKPLGCVGYAACGGILGQPGGDTARQGKGGADRGRRLGDGLVKAIALRLWAYKKANAGQRPKDRKNTRSARTRERLPRPAVAGGRRGFQYMPCLPNAKMRLLSVCRRKGKFIHTNAGENGRNQPWTKGWHMDDCGRKKGIYNINGEFFPVFLEFMKSPT